MTELGSPLPSPATRPARNATVALPLPLKALAAFDAIIDVRSPAEFAIDHLPGAISCPVLSDEQRAVVGTRYKQVSSFEAKKIGAAMVARNIADHIDRHFHAHPKSWKPLIYCWRGGARSGAMTHILRQIGWDARQLEGGYKAWRASVATALKALPGRFRFVAVCGRTGSGKSRLLSALAARGAQVLDLERMAAHKGSVLGDLPDRPQPSQKAFETAIWAALDAFEPARTVFIEAESKKVGSLHVPDALMRAMWASPCVELITPDSLRVSLLQEEYAHFPADPARLREKIACIAPLHSGSQVAHWMALIDCGDWDAFVRDLMANHYDPAYRRSMFRNYAALPQAMQVTLAAADTAGFAQAAEAILSQCADGGRPMTAWCAEPS